MLFSYSTAIYHQEGIMGAWYPKAVSKKLNLQGRDKGNQAVKIL